MNMRNNKFQLFINVIITYLGSVNIARNSIDKK